MFDLIGYWFAVTIMILPLIHLFVSLCTSLAAFYMHQISDGKVGPDRVLKWEPTFRILDYINKTDSLSLAVAFGVYLVAGGIWALIGWGLIIEDTSSFISNISNTATQASPFFGWIVMLGIGYLASMLVGKFVYKMGGESRGTQECAGYSHQR